ncbi:hypothetical protein ACFFIX_24505 [Metabacillus herbersteinensis]|uniref:Uncharacterized protein n=1 Tax=Metabacillus herbersteinensis TaxID=283816 RepID=A0ABV6GM24_9BACI
MAFIEVFGWIMIVILGITFIFSLIAVSKKPKTITKREEQRDRE